MDRHIPQLSMKQAYSLSTNKLTHGIDGYHVQKKYVDPIKIIQDRQNLKRKKGEKNRKHVTKKGSFLEDEERIHKFVPGPGQYPTSSQWPVKNKLKIIYADKKTYVDQIIKLSKRQKKPAPGQYNVVKTLKEEEAQVKRLASRKINMPDRISYLDQVQYEANLTPGVGNYNPRKRAVTEGTKSSINTKPQEWRKKHQLLDKKKPPKTPDMGTYNPIPTDYTIFDTITKNKQNKNFLGKVQRFKTSVSGSGLNPAKYNIIQQWRGKEKSSMSKHGLEVISKESTQTKSVYYH